MVFKIHGSKADKWNGGQCCYFVMAFQLWWTRGKTEELVLSFKELGRLRQKVVVELEE